MSYLVIQDGELSTMKESSLTDDVRAEVEEGAVTIVRVGANGKFEELSITKVEGEEEDDVTWEEDWFTVV